MEHIHHHRPHASAAQIASIGGANRTQGRIGQEGRKTQFAMW
jgi:hypothetical protein